MAAAVTGSENAATPMLANPKKAKLDRNSVKEILDQTVCEIMESKGHVVNDDKKSIHKLMEGAFFLALALFGPLPIQLFYENKMITENRMITVYIIVYSSLRAGRKLPGYFMEKNVFLFTYPLKASRNSTKLAFSSKLAKSSNTYTLSIDSATLESSSPVILSKDFSEWFAWDGMLMEESFRKDVEGLLFEYAEAYQKINMRRFWRLSLLELFVTLSLLGFCLMIYV